MASHDLKAVPVGLATKAKLMHRLDPSSMMDLSSEIVLAESSREIEDELLNASLDKYQCEPRSFVQYIRY